LTLSACRVTDWPLWGPPPARSEAYEIVRINDVAYYDEPGADSLRHNLDLYLPKGKKDFPVVVFVHGGAWMLGDNRCSGLYSSVGAYLARQGIGAVMPNYRLSPAVKHPEHAKDIARAVAWTKTHIAEHGGDPMQMFLMGHSAGGHLVALLATDNRHLNHENMSVADIRGVIAVSGVYRIPPGKTDVEIGGNTPLGVRLDEMAPIRGAGKSRDLLTREKPGVPVSVNVFGPAFGDDDDVRAGASPVNHVGPGLPPFLLVCADKDLPLLPEMAQDFHDRLLKKGCSSTLLTVEKRNHNSIIFQAIEPDDVAARAIVEFIRDHAQR
jgi:acetyl esterase/lipase